jgi:hypothetical protein
MAEGNDGIILNPKLFRIVFFFLPERMKLPNKLQKEPLQT